MSFRLECSCCNNHLEFLSTPTVEEIARYGYYVWNSRPGDADFYSTCAKCTAATMEDLKQDDIWGSHVVSYPMASMIRGVFGHGNDDDKQTVSHPNDRFFILE